MGRRLKTDLTNVQINVVDQQLHIYKICCHIIYYLHTSVAIANTDKVQQTAKLYK